MSSKRKPRVCGAGRKIKSSDKSKNRVDSGKAQASPWADPPAFDPIVVKIKAIQRDADRMQAAVEDDFRFFDANPARVFHLRNCTPCERDAFGPGWILVVRVRPDANQRIPIRIAALRFHDATAHDTEEKAAELFEWVMPRFGANIPPERRALLEPLRRRSVACA